MSQTISELLKARNLPGLCDREKMKTLLLENEYGYLPDTKWECSCTEAVLIDGRMCGGAVKLSKFDMTISSEYGSHTFPVFRLFHRDGKKHPFFILLNFHQVPSLYFPVEEVAEAGFDVITVCYKDVTSDDGDFSNGLAGVLLPPGARDSATCCGKIGLWSFAASRLMDYAEKQDCLDLNRSAILGHSRLGKTALVTGMLDERFRFVFSNDAGCAGDSIAKGSIGQLGITGRTGNPGETVEFINRTFPYWFCGNYKKIGEKGYSDEFDQHFLLATVAPRHVYVASASMDDWADPDSQFLCCAAASPAYEKLGLVGFVHHEKIPEVGDAYHEGMIGYHMRYGNHFLSRHDWQRYMEYMELHKND